MPLDIYENDNNPHYESLQNILDLIRNYSGSKDDLFDEIEEERNRWNLHQWYIQEFEKYVDKHIGSNSEYARYVIKQLERIVYKDK